MADTDRPAAGNPERPIVAKVVEPPARPVPRKTTRNVHTKG